MSGNLELETYFDKTSGITGPMGRVIDITHGHLFKNPERFDFFPKHENSLMTILFFAFTDLEVPENLQYSGSLLTLIVTVNEIKEAGGKGTMVEEIIIRESNDETLYQLNLDYDRSTAEKRETYRRYMKSQRMSDKDILANISSKYGERNRKAFFVSDNRNKNTTMTTDEAVRLLSHPEVTLRSPRQANNTLAYYLKN